MGWKKGKPKPDSWKKKVSFALKGRKRPDVSKKNLERNASQVIKDYYKNRPRPKFPLYKCNWKGGRIKDSFGYIKIYSPNHPYKKDNYVFEHRLVIEKKLGRYLLPTEKIHHINHKRNDNRIQNLQLFNNNGEHARFHRLNEPQRIRDRFGRFI